MKIVQFGEGNFLRAFVDWMMKPNSVMVVKPRPGKGLEKLQSLNFRYSVSLQGIQGGQTIDVQEPVDSIAGAIHPYEQFDRFMDLATDPELRFVISNTTEAGIQFDPACQLNDKPALSFPGKLTQFLYHRWQHFQGDASKGLVLLPCELIFHNGNELSRCILQYVEAWKLEADFRRWFQDCCTVCNTLVDRIVPGGPDPAVVQAEPYHLWVIEGPESLQQELPLRDAAFNIRFTNDEQPYHLLKVTLLNGPHTALSAVGHLAGLETVRDCMLHPIVGAYIQQVMMKELLPNVPLPLDEVNSYALTIQDRFLNPYVHHLLTSILLNNLAKFKTRDLPALLHYVQMNGCLPPALTVALAANLICAKVEDVTACLKDVSLWEQDLSQIPDLTATVEQYVTKIREQGMQETLSTLPA